MLRSQFFKVAELDEATLRERELDDRIRREKPTVYMAGPMFNEGEKRTNADLTAAIEAAGFEAFLPQRDGFEFGLLHGGLVELGFDEKQAGQILEAVIFAYDIYQVMRTDLTVYNNEGRTPDEGAVSENATGWMFGKRAILYSTDLRSKINGSNNPLVTGLCGFTYAKTHDEVIEQLKANYVLFKAEVKETLEERVAKLPPSSRQAFELGQQIDALKKSGKDNIEIAREAVAILRPELLESLPAETVSVRPVTV